MLRLMFSKRWWWTTLIVLAAIGVTIRLGIWQLDRQKQRDNSINQVKSVQAMPVLDLNQNPLPTDLQDMEYRQVKASGVFDFDHQVAIRNQARSLDLGDEPGFALLIPLILTNGTAVLVDRGWIPLQYDTTTSWQQFDEPGTVSLEGIIRLSMEKGEMSNALVDPTLSPGEDHLDFWNYANLTRLQNQIPYPILKIYIQQAPTSAQESLPYRRLEQPDLDPSEHIGFALQWFFFTSLLVFGYPVWLRKQKAN